MAVSKTRRISLVVLAVLVVMVVVVGAVVWPRPPQLAAERTGDPALLAAIEATDGLHRVSVATVALGEGGAAEVTYANVGADEHTAYEAGSITKALTGLVLADQVRRGELALDQPVDAYLPLGGTATGSRTLQELVTHSSGLPPLGTATRLRGIGTLVTAGNPYGSRSVDDVLGELRDTEPSAAGTYAYSNLGAAAAGLAGARAAGTDYPTLMQERLISPLGLRETRLQTGGALVDGGLSPSGRAQAPWVMSGYAPAGSVVSTSADLAVVATALLQGKAPGMTALEPLAAAGDGPGREIGYFWQRSVRDGHTITWHNGATGGYHAFLGLDRDRKRAVVVLADVQTDAVDQLGMDLATRP